MKKSTSRTELQQKGDFGERVAFCFFQQHGFQCIQQNFYSRFGELDLIFEDNLSKTLIFIEVRLRKYFAMVSPSESVNRSKQQKIYYAVEDFLLQHSKYQEYQCRIDVCSIYSDISIGDIQQLMSLSDEDFCLQTKILSNLNINWIKNAFEF